MKQIESRVARHLPTPQCRKQFNLNAKNKRRSRAIDANNCQRLHTTSSTRRQQPILFPLFSPVGRYVEFNYVLIHISLCR